MRYIGLLRGINVGGNNKVPMPELRNCFTKAGFANVITYINSGNIIFDSDELDMRLLTNQCETIIELSFGFPISMALLNIDMLREGLNHAPEWWGSNPESKHNAIFVIAPATAQEIMEEVGNAKEEYEQVFAHQTIIFWSAPVKTFSRTRWSKIVGTKAYSKITIRNANTTRKLFELAEGSNDSSAV